MLLLPVSRVFNPNPMIAWGPDRVPLSFSFLSAPRRARELWKFSGLR